MCKCMFTIDFKTNTFALSAITFFNITFHVMLHYSSEVFVVALFWDFVVVAVAVLLIFIYCITNFAIETKH